MDFNDLLNNVGRWVMTGGVRIFVVLLVLLVLYKIARLFLDHAIARLETNCVESTSQAAHRIVSLYRASMQSIGLTPETSRTGPYNLLLTRRWMLLVPRYAETFHEVSLNALAFAGALLLRDRQQLNHFQRHGPMAALTHVATRSAAAPDGC